MSVVYITEKILDENRKLQTKEILDYCPCGCGTIKVFVENTLFVEVNISVINPPEQIIIKGTLSRNGFELENSSKGEIGKVTKIESIDDLKNITKKENE